jgi:hypothetical protein
VFLVGLDPGKVRDPSALVVVERKVAEGNKAIYDVTHMERRSLGTSYSCVVDRTVEVMGNLPIGSRLLFDATGVGAVIVDLLRQEGLRPIPVTITAGTQESQGPDGTRRVPKSRLITPVQVLLQSGRLRIAAALPEAEALVQELLDFRSAVSRAGHVTYAAREGAHDDLVIAVALCLWYGRHGGREPSQVRRIMDPRYLIFGARGWQDRNRRKSLYLVDPDRAGLPGLLYRGRQSGPRLIDILNEDMPSGLSSAVRRRHR